MHVSTAAAARAAARGISGRSGRVSSLLHPHHCRQKNTARIAAGRSCNVYELQDKRSILPSCRGVSSSAPRCAPQKPSSPPQEDDLPSFSDAHFGQERDRQASKIEGQRRQQQQEPQQPPTHENKDASRANIGPDNDEPAPGTYSEADHEHAVISAFDLFSIGIGPSSSHTVGPMRAGNIFVNDLIEADLLAKVAKIRIGLYGSLAATGEGHMTPSALLLGLEGVNVETVDTAWVPARFQEIKSTGQLHLGRETDESKGGRQIAFDYASDLVWQWGKTLPLHSNGMRLTVFDDEGTMLATNDLFSVGGGFVVNGALSTASSSRSGTAAGAVSGSTSNEADHAPAVTGHPADLAENLYYKNVRRAAVAGDRKTGADLRPLQLESGEPLAIGSGSADSKSESVGTGNKLQPASVPAEDEVDLKGPGAASSQPIYPFRDAASLLALCKKHNLTIAQIVYENERSLGFSDKEIRSKILDIWQVMDDCIKEGVQAEDDTLPGSLKLHRRAPALYRRLTRGLYPSTSGGRSHDTALGSGSRHESLSAAGSSHASPGAGSEVTVSTGSRASSGALSSVRSGPPRVHGSFQHPILPSPPRRTTFPAIDYLTVYAMAVNEVNAAGGRVVTAPTNGAAGVIPAVLKYTLEFMSDDDGERDVFTFLLTAAAIGMLFKRGASISAAEGGCMAEIGVACSMAAGGFAACMGASPMIIEQAAEIGIEHNLGLTCDPIGGLVQAPCIERNALGAIKAISSANLALSSSGTQKVSLDDAIKAMRLTAQGMRHEFKETSLSGLATSVSLNIPVSVPDC